MKRWFRSENFGAALMSFIHTYIHTHIHTYNHTYNHTYKLLLSIFGMTVFSLIHSTLWDEYDKLFLILLAYKREFASTVKQPTWSTTAFLAHPTLNYDFNSKTISITLSIPCNQTIWLLHIIQAHFNSTLISITLSSPCNPIQAHMFWQAMGPKLVPWLNRKWHVYISSSMLFKLCGVAYLKLVSLSSLREGRRHLVPKKEKLGLN